MLNQNWMLVHNISAAFGYMSVLGAGVLLFLDTWLVWPVAFGALFCFLVSEVAERKA